jgi:hypothetical protein
MFVGKKLPELPVPDGVHSAAQKLEILRAWIVDGGLHVSLNIGFDNPDVWGIALRDIARHAARAYADQGIMSEAEALGRITSMWANEEEQPTNHGTTKRSH